MGKSNRIKWSETDYKELQRQRKNFNAKITRLENKGYNPALLPQRISAKQIIAETEFRRDLNNLKKEIINFTKRGSEELVTYKGQVLPQFEKKRVETMIRSVQQVKANKRKQLSQEKGNTHLSKETELKALNIDKPRNLIEWNKFVKSLEKQYSTTLTAARAKAYKTNYLKSIKSLGNIGKELYDYINELDADMIASGYLHDAVMEIDFTYDPTAAKVKAQAALTAWKNYVSSIK